MNVLDLGVLLAIPLVRLLVPLLITIAVGAILRRLDARWEAEVRARLQTEDKAAAGEPVLSSEAPWPLPVTPQVSWNEFGVPCWIVKSCDEATRISCAAFADAAIPCWLARRRIEGRIPLTCYRCVVFAFSDKTLAAGNSNHDTLLAG
ncbi:MAG: hypothetical protein D6791_06305 [Chloroflexi bacterium]|nr:MAG: hypothetical protein D6791_06305 [Chloroflexota bacterium]